MNIKDFHLANLSEDKLSELKRIEAELSEKFGTDLVLIAWQKD